MYINTINRIFIWASVNAAVVTIQWAQCNSHIRPQEGVWADTLIDPFETFDFYRKDKELKYYGSLGSNICIITHMLPVILPLQGNEFSKTKLCIFFYEKREIKKTVVAVTTLTQQCLLCSSSSKFIEWWWLFFILFIFFIII